MVTLMGIGIWEVLVTEWHGLITLRGGTERYEYEDYGIWNIGMPGILGC